MIARLHEWGARDILKEIGDSMDQPARSVLLYMRDRLRDWSMLLHVSLQKRPEYHIHIHLSMLCIDDSQHIATIFKWPSDRFKRLC